MDELRQQNPVANISRLTVEEEKMSLRKEVQKILPATMMVFVQNLLINP